MNDTLQSLDIKTLLDNPGDIPALSPVVSKVLSLIRSEDVSAKELAGVIQNDNSLTMKVLKVVNSAYYAIPSKISTIAQAVVILGFDTIKNLVLSMSILELLVSNTEQVKQVQNLWERSLFMAVTARQIAVRRKEKANPDEAFIAGLLADVGMLMFVRHAADSYIPLVIREQEGVEDLTSMEREIFDVDHCAVGMKLAEKWGFPDKLSQPIAWHHDMTNADDMSAELEELSRITLFARRCASVIYHQNLEDSMRDARLQAEIAFGMENDQLDEFLVEVFDEVEKTADFFGVKLEEQANYMEILQEANRKLSQMNLSYEQMNQKLRKANERAEKLAAQLQEANAKLQELVNIDPLTGVHNRRSMTQFLEHEYVRARRYDRHLALLLLDIDHFKKVNDTFGHPQGDSILREMSNLIKGLLRDTDMLVRYGGEEFLVMLPEAKLYAARIAAERIRRNVETHDFAHLPDSTMHITISIGVTELLNEEVCNSTEELIKAADLKLYEAKENGRNRIAF
ncbi:MAG: GGDEF domain-containing protein [Candidatus Delongbacteria bacterium]|nr:GGDEF domain-containing protein [bacterium]MBL7033530.1 GGDEF domain-containing protein [Candidatus Delongbacteria bacterium]